MKTISTRLMNVPRAAGWTMVVAAGALALSGCVTRETRIVERPAAAAPPIIVQQPVTSPQVRAMPGPIMEERGPAPAAGWSWLPGHWRYDGVRWVWQPGKWVQHAVPAMPPAAGEQMGAAPSPTHYWVPGYWEWNANINNWQWVRGAWRS